MERNPQLDEWIAQYGTYPATVRGLPGGRVRYLVITDPNAMIEGETLPLETADPDGTLYANAGRVLSAVAAYNANREDDDPRRDATLADLINGDAADRT